MRSEELKKLLQQDESVYLEYKRSIDLDAREGKAKLLKEVLSLANSLQGRAYLVIGVEEKDKQKTVVGMEGVGEEQIQQVIAEWCRPKIEFDFEIFPYEGKKIGVMTIYANRPPHTVKKKFGYPEKNKAGKHIKQSYLAEHEVFVRSGSTIETASPEEIIEMAQRDRDGLEAVVSRLDRIADWQEETAEAIYSQSRSMRNSNDRWESWLTVPILIALVTGSLLGWQWEQVPGTLFPVISSVISIFILSTFAIIGVSEFTLKQAFWSTVILAFAFWILGKADSNFFLGQAPVVRIFYTGFIGTLVAGLPASIVTIFIN
jgi:hypothetical protein